MKKILNCSLLFLSIFSLASCSNSYTDALMVYNCGEYIDPDLINEFENEFNCKINYVTFDSNETAVTKMQTEAFDVVVPSDYAIELLKENDMLQEIDWSRITDFTIDMLADPVIEILKMLKNQENGFDFLKYSVPYFFGNVGICYDKNKVNEEDILEGWNILHNEKYMNKVAYYDSSRDGFMAAYKALGYSMNSTNLDETEEAYNWILEIRNKTNCAFKTDELLSEMPDGKYAISLMYSGDAIYSMMEENDNVDLDFYVPENGTNVFVDGMVIPKNAKHVDMAYNFISFMLRHENAVANSVYVGYASPVKSAYLEAVTPDGEFYDYKDYYEVTIHENDEIYRYNPKMTILLNDYWTRLKLS